MFHENLKRCRETAGLTQAAFAKVLNVSLRTVQNWEQGHREPALDVVSKIARTLGVSTDALLETPAKKTRQRKGQ